jgi:hypothetical protein
MMHDIIMYTPRDIVILLIPVPVPVCIHIAIAFIRFDAFIVDG